MKKLYLFIIYIALFGFCIAAPSYGKENLSAVHRKRFLFQTVTFCFGPCSLKCAAGYQKSHMGCYNCACAQSQVLQSASTLSNNQFVPSNFSFNAGHIGHFFTNPCDPSIRHCPLDCSLGYKQGTNGCEFCECVHSLLTAATAISISVTSIPKGTKPTRTQTPSVTKFTTEGKKPTSNIRPTTKRSISGYVDPCIPTQTVCHLNCNNDYVLGPEKCQYCLCADKIPPQLRPTTTRVPAVPPGLQRSNSSLANSSKTSSKPTAEACVMAKVICNEKCPGGFVSKPDDCLFCSCLQNESVTADEIVRMNLRKPCLYNRLDCKTKCTKGYIKGPRNCQFCSCMK